MKDDTTIFLDKSIYLGILLFIKTRLKLVNEFLEDKRSTGTFGTNTEFLALQFRKILEEIALSSLVLHIDKYSKLRTEFEKDWNARLILQDIKRLNPSYFPVPVKIIELDKISENFSFEVIDTRNGKYLTEKDFIKIYERCGKILHAFNPYSKITVSPHCEKKSMLIWHEKISNLLNEHYIKFFDSDYVAHTKMNFEDKNMPDLTVFKPH